jgi:GT2 family glycosyltransferase
LQQGFEGSQDFDLVLRATEKARKIAHIPQVLYHWRASPGSTALSVSAKGYATESGIRAVQEHLARAGVVAKVSQGPIPTAYQIDYALTRQPRVTIIIPNSDHAADLNRCISSILERSTYTDFEILIVDNNSREEATFQLYRELQHNPHVTVLHNDEQPFNFSAVNNYAAARAQNEVLLFLNNDTEIISPDWLEKLLQFILSPDVGIVGAKLYYPNDTVQHAGVIIGIQGVAGHSHKHAQGDSHGYFQRLRLPQEVSAVTGACLMIKRAVFQEVSGFDPFFKLAFGDVDLCLKVRQKGYLVMWTPYAELYHHESKTRGPEDTHEKRVRASREAAYFKRKWTDFLAEGDPYYNPNLTLASEDFSLNFSRRAKESLCSGRIWTRSV